MNRLIIADSACLIALEQIDELELLAAIFDEILVPPKVEEECGIARPWLKVVQPTNQTAIDSLKLMVDDGEAEAIALAAELSLTVILDDRAARRIAASMGISMIGTIGCLLKAKAVGAIPAILPIIEKLERVDFYLSDELKAKALHLAGE